MPGQAQDEREAKLSKGVLVSAALGGLCGVISIIVSGVALDSEALWTVDRLVRVNNEFDGQSQLFPTTRSMIFVVLVAGCISIVTSSAGVIGGHTKQKIPVTVYVIVAAITSIFFLFFGWFAFYRMSIVAPMIERQVTTYCNATTYERLALNAPCEWAAGLYGTAVPACGDICQNRITVLNSFSGCDILPELCKLNVYKDTTAAECITEIDATEGPVMYATGPGVLTESECLNACDQDIACDGIISYGPSVTTSVCVKTSGLLVRSPLQPLDPTVAAWTPMARPLRVSAALAAGIESTLTCKNTDYPSVIDSYNKHASRAGIVIITLGVILLISTTLACFFMYELNMGRPNTPSPGSICYAMLCPCLVDTSKGVPLADKDSESGQDSES